MLQLLIYTPSHTHMHNKLYKLDFLRQQLLKCLILRFKGHLTRTILPRRLHWTLLTSSKCHKSGQHKIIHKHIIYCWKLYISNSPQHSTINLLKLYFKIIFLFSSTLNTVINFSLCINCYYQLNLCGYATTCCLPNSLYYLRPIHCSLLYYFMGCFISCFFTSYGIYGMWT